MTSSSFVGLSQHFVTFCNGKENITNGLQGEASDFYFFARGGLNLFLLSVLLNLNLGGSFGGVASLSHWGGPLESLLCLVVFLEYREKSKVFFLLL